MTLQLSEHTIQNQIKDFLNYRGIPCYRINAGMVAYGEGKARRFIKMAEAGFSDLVAVLPPYGQAVFIECKRPGKKPTTIQTAFLSKMEGKGAIAFVATSIEDVQKALHI